MKAAPPSREQDGWTGHHRRTIMANDCTEENDDATAIARTLQFGDSMFPIGGFSFSCGLESAVQRGVVVDTSTLHAFARTQVEQAARGDGVALIHAHRAATADDVDALVRIDKQVEARKLSEEMRTMSTRMGKKFAEMSALMVGAPLLCEWRDRVERSSTPGCYPVALAISFAAQRLSALAAFVVHQNGVAATTLGAALRLMKISHVDTQKILYELNGGAGVAYEIAASTRLSNMAGYAPLAEILAAVHARAHVRLFMN
jgi:urease accessory protein